MRGIVRLVQGLYYHRAGDVAPAMAFHFFLSLVPVLVLVGFVLGLVVRQRGVDALLGPVMETAPGASEAIVREELQRMAGAGGASVAPLSVLGFVWLAATGTHGLMDAFETASGAARRDWWKKRVIALASVAVTLVVLALVGWGTIQMDAMIHRDDAADAPVATVASATATHPPPIAHRTPPPHVERAVEHTDRIEPADPSRPSFVKRARRHLGPLFRDAWERYAILAILAAVALGILAAFYRFAVEHPRGVVRRAWPGACVAFAAWLAVSWGFGVYVSTLGRYALFYGSVATVAVLLVWLYLSSWALLVGAELNAQLEGLRDAKAPSERSSAPPSR